MCKSAPNTTLKLVYCLFCFAHFYAFGWIRSKQCADDGFLPHNPVVPCIRSDYEINRMHIVVTYAASAEAKTIEWCEIWFMPLQRCGFPLPFCKCSCVSLSYQEFFRNGLNAFGMSALFLSSYPFFPLFVLSSSRDQASISFCTGLLSLFSEAAKKNYCPFSLLSLPRHFQWE